MYFFIGSPHTIQVILSYCRNSFSRSGAIRVSALISLHVMTDLPEATETAERLGKPVLAQLLNLLLGFEPVFFLAARRKSSLFSLL